MSYIPVGFTAAEEKTLLANQKAILDAHERLARSRRMTLIIGVASALFAAGRLGILGVTTYRARKRA
ncbi:MAG: hypothetical protein R3322_00100 [Kiloniellales bacterium]|nr:hypothetical protein [Kiloniellales bacterium]